MSRHVSRLMGLGVIAYRQPISEYGIQKPRDDMGRVLMDHYRAGGDLPAATDSECPQSGGACERVRGCR